MACAHVSSAEQMAPSDPPGVIVSPSASCCTRTEQAFWEDEQTPFGAVSVRLAELGAIRCGLRYVDGTHSEVLIRAEGAREVKFFAANVNESSCKNLCFSELQAKASVLISSADGRVAAIGEVALRELEEAGSGLSFEWVRDAMLIRGSLQLNEPNLRVMWLKEGESDPQPLAEAVAPCVSLSKAQQ